MQLRTNKVKGLVGPVYQSEDVSHSYSEIQKHVQRFSNLTGSGDLGLGEDNRSSFDIIVKPAEKMQQLVGPVYVYEGKNVFSELMKTVD